MYEAIRALSFWCRFVSLEKGWEDFVAEYRLQSLYERLVGFVDISLLVTVSMTEGEMVSQKSTS